MQKVILDTNILVSSCIQHGYPYLVVRELFSTRVFEIAISDELFKEYIDVLNRERFQKYPDFIIKARQLLVYLESSGIKYSPTVRVNLISDKDDNKLLELAETCKAEFLITGNLNDFTMSEYKGTKIVTPAEFWTEYLSH